MVLHHSFRWLLPLLVQLIGFSAYAQYRAGYSSPTPSYNSYNSQLQQQQQQQSFNRLNQIRQDQQIRQQQQMQQSQQFQRQQQENSTRQQQSLRNGMLYANNASITQAMQTELLQRYAADDTAMALIRMFKRKRGGGWPWLVGGLGGGGALMLTSYRSEPYTTTNGAYRPQSGLRTGRLVVGSLVMLGGYIGYFAHGIRYNFERLTEVLIAREQHRPIPVRYLQQLRGRDFSPFQGEVVK